MIQRYTTPRSIGPIEASDGEYVRLEDIHRVFRPVLASALELSLYGANIPRLQDLRTALENVEKELP